MDVFLQGLVYLIGLRLLGLPSGLAPLQGFSNMDTQELIDSYMAFTSFDFQNQTSVAFMQIVCAEDTGRSTGVPWKALPSYAKRLKEIFEHAVRSGLTLSAMPTNVAQMHVVYLLSRTWPAPPLGSDAVVCRQHGEWVLAPHPALNASGLSLKTNFLASAGTQCCAALSWRGAVPS